MAVQIATAQTIPTDEGGTCTDGCYDHYRAEVTLNSGATPVILWEDLSQAGWGSAASFSPTELIAIYFLFPGNAAFDLVIDDLVFVQ
jgi:hypothetical protein